MDEPKCENECDIFKALKKARNKVKKDLILNRWRKYELKWGGSGSRKASQEPLGVSTSLVTPTVKYLPARQETWVRSLGWQDPLEKGMATHSSIFAWRIPCTEEPGGVTESQTQLTLLLGLVREVTVVLKFGESSGYEEKGYIWEKNPVGLSDRQDATKKTRLK